MRRLAVDISAFSRMRELNYVYVDKIVLLGLALKREPSIFDISYVVKEL